MVVAVQEFSGEEVLTSAQKVTVSDPQQIDQSDLSQGLLFQSRRGAQSQRTWTLDWEETTDATVALVMAHFSTAGFAKFRFNRLTGGSSGPIVQYVASPQVTWKGQKTAAITLQLFEKMG